MKYIFTTGRTDALINNRNVPGIVGMAIQSTGNSVTYLSIEPQLNIGTGNIDLRRCGEVFVLADGSEVPLSLGVFERCCGVELTAQSHLTMGRILQECISGLERSTDTQMVGIEEAVEKYIKQHLEDAATEWNAKGLGAPLVDYLVVDLGNIFASSDAGAALIASAVNCFINSLLPTDFAFLNVEDKAENFCKSGVYKLVDNFIKNTKSTVQETTILSLLISNEENCCSLLNYPQEDSGFTSCSRRLFSSSGVFELLVEVPFFRAPGTSEVSHESRVLAQDSLINIEHGENDSGAVHSGDAVKIAILAELGPEYMAYHSVELALKRAGTDRGHSIEVVYIMVGKFEGCVERVGSALEGVSGVLAPGGFGKQYLDAKLAFVRHARMHNIPFLGICLGHQIAIIEFARNVLKIKNATSEEFDCSSLFPVIRKVPSIRCANTGKDIFLGNYPVEYRGCGREIYSASAGVQRFRHRYALNNIYKEELEKFGMLLIGKSTNDRAVAFKLQNHRFFAGVQYHPELNTDCADVDPALSAFVYEILSSNADSRYN